MARSSEDMAMAMSSSGGRTSDARTNQLDHMLKAWVASPVQMCVSATTAARGAVNCLHQPAVSTEPLHFYLRVFAKTKFRSQILQ